MMIIRRNKDTESRFFSIIIESCLPRMLIGVNWKCSINGKELPLNNGLILIKPLLLPDKSIISVCCMLITAINCVN